MPDTSAGFIRLAESTPSVMHHEHAAPLAIGDLLRVSAMASHNEVAP
jgi:hypothetical protein